MSAIVSRPPAGRAEDRGGRRHKLAKACTSGQALTGGAQLNLGSWVFMLAVFAAGYLLAAAVRRQWR